MGEKLGLVQKQLREGRMGEGWRSRAVQGFRGAEAQGKRLRGAAGQSRRVRAVPGSGAF